jgi:hypothetical protein
VKFGPHPTALTADHGGGDLDGELPLTPQGLGKVARRPFHGISSSGVRARRSREVGGTYVAKRGRVAAAARVG